MVFIMIKGFYAGASGLKSHQQSIDVSANNIANVNTAGYKAQNTGFTELLYNNMVTGEGGEPKDLVSSAGSKAAMAPTVFTKGTLEPTGRSLDAAIESEGFFALMNQNGEVYYTRAGEFILSQQNGQWYLAAPNGDLVLDADKKPIAVAKPASELELAAPSSNNADALRPGIFTFKNTDGLVRAGNTGFYATASSGEAVIETGAVLRQRCLERSTVDLAAELTKVITAQRGFQLNARLVQTAEEIEQITNSLRA